MQTSSVRLTYHWQRRNRSAPVLVAMPISITLSKVPICIDAPYCSILLMFFINIIHFLLYSELTIVSTIKPRKGVCCEKQQWLKGRVLGTVAGVLLAGDQCPHGVGSRDHVWHRGRKSLGDSHIHLEQAAPASLGGWLGIWHEPAGAA